MNNINKYNQYLISIVVFTLPFLEFVKNNINEIDIILDKSFYLLFLVLFSLLIILSIFINKFNKKLSLEEVFIIVTLSYWLIFKHNIINFNLKKSLEHFNSFLTSFSSEISILIILIIIIFIYFLIKKKKFIFSKVCLYIFYIKFFS